MRRRDAASRAGLWRSVLGVVAVVAGTGGAAALAPGTQAAAQLPPSTVSVPWAQVNGAANGCSTSCPASPAPRSGDEMAYDAATGQMILFGGLGNGLSYSATYNDTWDWTGNGWTQLDDAADPGCTSSCSASPPERAVPAMAYDTATGQVVLFGGQGGGSTHDSYLNDTWVWNGSTWTQVDDTTDPGCGSYTYVTSVTDECTSSPPVNTGMSMAYDPATRQLILFSGARYTNATWDWNGSTWTQVDDTTDPGCGYYTYVTNVTDECTSSPPADPVGVMGYDAASRQLVLFGDGYNGNATWDWNGSTWTQVDDGTSPTCGSAADLCPSSPPGRTGASMAYDPTLGGLVLFGGFVPPSRNDTWLWSGTSWTQIDDSTDPGCGTGASNPCPSGPAVRSVAPFARDTATGQMVLFGGQGGIGYTGPFLDDTWIVQFASQTTCIPSSRACESGSGTTATVTSDKVSVTSTGRGTVAVGTFRPSQVSKLEASTGKFFGVSVSVDNALKSLVVKDCNTGGGTALMWWNGKAWVKVLGESGSAATSSGGCLSVALGTTSTPSIAAIARQSRLSRFQAAVFGVA